MEKVETCLVAVFIIYIIAALIVLNVVWRREIRAQNNTDWKKIKRITVFFYLFPCAAGISLMPWIIAVIGIVLLPLLRLVEISTMLRVSDVMRCLWEKSSIPRMDTNDLEQMEAESMQFYLIVAVAGFCAGMLLQYLTVHTEFADFVVQVVHMILRK